MKINPRHSDSTSQAAPRTASSDKMRPADALFQAAFEGSIFLLVMTAFNLVHADWIGLPLPRSVWFWLFGTIVFLVPFTVVRTALAMRGPRVYSDPSLALRGRMNMLLSASIIVMASIVVRWMLTGSIATADAWGPLVIASALAAYAVVCLKRIRNQPPPAVTRQVAAIGFVSALLMAIVALALWTTQLPGIIPAIIFTSALVMAASAAMQWRSTRRASSDP